MNFVKIILFSVIVVAMFGLVIPNVSAQEQVPSWVKNTAGWWATNAISETEFVNAIEFLIQNNIIVVEGNVSSLLLTWDEIESVLVDGDDYSDFDSHILNTIDGKHTYHVFLK